MLTKKDFIKFANNLAKIDEGWGKFETVNWKEIYDNTMKEEYN